MGLPREDDGAHVDDDRALPGVDRAGARLSPADRGLTFGTDTRAGACLTFYEPVPGIEPTGLLRHPSLTVTIEQPHLLVRRLRQIIDA